MIGYDLACFGVSDRFSKYSSGKVMWKVELINSWANSVFGLEKISLTVPCSIRRPLSITATWSQIRLTTSISWVIRRMVIPKVRLISFNNFRMDWVVAGSNALVASSQSKTFGSLASARAIATRCF